MTSIRRLAQVAATVGTLAVGALLAAADDAAKPPAPGRPAPAAEAPAPPRVWALDAAAAEGLLEVHGAHPTTCVEVDLTLVSRSKEPILVDLAGRHLRPTTGDVQRLGLSHPITPSDRPRKAPRGTYPISLAPGEKRTVRMHTCCLDAGKGCPRPGDLYELPGTPTPPVAETALRWWVDHPKAEQGFVNTAIWQSDPSLLEPPPPPPPTPADPAPPPPPPPPFPHGRSVCSFAGTVYLVDDGMLTSLDREGVRRFHATGIWSAWPTSAGLLAVGVGRTELELWRFGETGDPPWMRLFPVGRQPIARLVPGKNDAFLVVRAGEAAGSLGKVAFATGAGVSEDAFRAVEADRDAARPLGVAAADAAKDRAVLALWSRTTTGPDAPTAGNLHPRAPTVEVYDVDLRTGKTALRKAFWTLRSLAAGPAGTYGVSTAGRLVRLDGERLVDLPPDDSWVDVVAVGAERLVARSALGRLASVDVRSGRALALPDGAAAASTASPSTLSVDPKTDQVLWLQGDVAKRWTPGRTDTETISFR